jgi:hypothetical protein
VGVFVSRSSNTSLSGKLFLAWCPLLLNHFRSTLVASQVPVKHWHEIIANPTPADAILDRLVHNAYKLVLNG